MMSEQVKSIKDKEFESKPKPMEAGEESVKISV